MNKISSCLMKRIYNQTNNSILTGEKTLLVGSFVLPSGFVSCIYLTEVAPSLPVSRGDF